MSKSANDCVKVATAEFARYAQEWLLTSELEQLSKSTVNARMMFMRHIQWFLEHRNFEECGTLELKHFLHYLRTSHELPEGRWGKPECRKPLRPITIKDYYTSLKLFFDWLVAEEVIDVNPMAKIDRPRVRQETKQPLTNEQVEALLLAARSSNKPRRNEAIILMLCDSGVRASELINLKVKDVDLVHGTFEVIGKGSKKRQCYVGANTLKALMAYLRKAKLPADAPLFPSTDNGQEPLSRSGLLHLMKRLGKKAGVKVNVHQMRRTFATSMLQNGADVCSVQSLLGHSTVTQTLAYLAVAKSHIEGQHRKFSPGDRLAMK